MESTKSEVSSEIPKNRVDLDTILVEEIGQFGWFQLRTLILAGILAIFAIWGVSEYVFTTARISTRCLIRECELAENAEFAPEWILNAVPGTSSTSFDNCQRYANTSQSSTIIDGTCPTELFDSNTLVDCDQFVYENTNTVVYDYNLACDEWRRTLIGSVRTVGTLIAFPVTGYISDRWGRKTALILNALNTAWIGVTRYWANTYIGFMISEVVEATFGSAGFSSAYILLMEIVGPKYRVAAGATMNSFASVGHILLGLIAWGVPHWRMLTLTLYIPMFLAISYIWIMTESIRWYMSKGRYKESEALLKKIARVNNKQLSEKSLAALRETAESDKRRKAIEEAESLHEPWLIIQVFRNKPILIRCLVSPIWWITNILIYYGMSINAVNISGNRYLNYVAVAAAEIPGYWTAVFFMGKIGRKPVLIGAFWGCAAFQIAYIFMPENLFAVSFTVYLLGTYCIAIVMTSVYVYTAELYPTKYRHRLFAFSATIGRVGSIIAPLTPAFGAATFEKLPFVLFASFALLSGLLIFVTPETFGTKLPDTMQEACDIGKKETC